MKSPSLEIFSTQLDMALCNQPALTGPSPNGVGLGVWFGVEGVDYMISRGPFQPKFYDSKTKHDSTVHCSSYLARKDQSNYCSLISI